MSTVLDLWLATPFRRAVEKILQLSDDALRELADAEDLTSVDLSLGTGDQLASSAFLTLYEAARDDGVTDVASDLRKLLSSADDPSVYERGLDRLPSLLRLRPMFDRRTAVRRERAGAFPQIDEVSLAVNFRAMDSPGRPGEVELVPIVTARLEFDEYVFGTDSLTLGLTVEALRDLQMAIARVITQYEAIAPTLRPRLLSAEAELDFRDLGGVKPEVPPRAAPSSSTSRES